MTRAGLWARLPILVRAVLQGLAVAAVGILPWPFLVEANLASAPGFPWAAPVGLAWVGALLAWLAGRGSPRSSSAARRRLLRLAPPAGGWWLAFVSGAFYVLGLAGLRIAGWMLVATDVSALAELRAAAALPATTAIPLLLVGAVVAGVVEEAGFRGYMQMPLEGRYRPSVAIGVVALIFAIFHFPGPVVLPVFAVAATGWGILAYLTGSIVPGMILHAALDAGFWLWAVANVRVVEDLLVASIFEGEMIPAFGIVAGVTLAASIAAGLGFRALAKRRHDRGVVSPHSP